MINTTMGSLYLHSSYHATCEPRTVLINNQITPQLRYTPCESLVGSVLTILSAASLFVIGVDGHVLHDQQDNRQLAPVAHATCVKA